MNRKLPVVVIVGRPNVGKSTLFNRLIKQRVAVVEDEPGITRDRLYADMEWRGRAFTVVDTGGILFNDDDPLVEQIRVQAQIARQSHAGYQTAGSGGGEQIGQSAARFIRQRIL